MRFKTFADVNYDEIVSRDYRMNPNIEDVIYADELEDGMVVLPVSTYRQNENSPMLQQNSEALLRQNRWCVITKLRKELEVIEVPKQDLVTEMIDGTEEVVAIKKVTFIGVYNDGDKQIQSSPPEQGWLVRTDKKSLAEVTRDIVKANQENREPDEDGV